VTDDTRTLLVELSELQRRFADAGARANTEPERTF
jgi:hypothetical protein